MPQYGPRLQKEHDKLFAQIEERMTTSSYVMLECYIHRLGRHWYGEALGIHISKTHQPGPDDEWLNSMPCHYLLRWYTNGDGWISRDGLALPKATLDKINELVAS
jgi:phage gp37-like protein